MEDGAKKVLELLAQGKREEAWEVYQDYFPDGVAIEKGLPSNKEGVKKILEEILNTKLEYPHRASYDCEDEEAYHLYAPALDVLIHVCTSNPSDITALIEL